MMTKMISSKHVGGTTVPTDESLLALFVQKHDAQAFHQLVQRHAQLVWSVCRRIVRRHQSAEDAFQATFVVLLQKAEHLQLRSSMSTWLYGVAIRVAHRAQARDTRLLSDRSSETTVDPSDPYTNLTVRELIDVVQMEMAKLPKRYQPVLELCLLNQVPVRLAAERLQLSPGTVRGCLQRGRELLQARLLRRGITPLAITSLSLTALHSHQLPLALLTQVQGFTSQTVPAKLLTLIGSTPPSLNPLMTYLAVTLILFTGIGFGLIQMIPTVASAMPAETTHHIIEPVKPVTIMQGFVDDHEGKPVPSARVEVYRENKLEQTLTADGVGRFEMPGIWKKEPGVNRTLVVRQGNSALGWSDKMNYYTNIPHDLRIVMLPLQAIVRGAIRNEKGEKISGNVGNDCWFNHPVNGSISFSSLPSGVLKLPGIVDQQGRFSIKLPIHTQGMFFLGTEKCIDRRITYAASGAGTYDVEEVGLKPAGIIKGVVVSPEGQPVVGAILGAQFNQTDRKQLHVLDGVWGRSTTDQQGRFEFRGLDPRLAFNIYLLEPVPVTGETVPLVLRAKEAVKVSTEKPTELVLKLEKGRKLEGRVVEVQSKKPLGQVGIGYYGSARPRSSAGIMYTFTNSQGEFHFWAPPGDAMLYCNDGQCNASIDMKVPETDPLGMVTLEAEKAMTPATYLGAGVSSAQPVLKVTDEQPVIAEGETQRAEWVGCYQQLIEFQSESALPTTAHWRVYQKDKPLESTIANAMSGHMSLTNKTIMITVNDQGGQPSKVELDLEGYQPIVQEFPAAGKHDPVAIKLVPTQMMPVQVNVIDSRDKPVAQARVQVELKRLGKVIDAPWGPVALTTSQGSCRMEHLRMRDTYRLHAFSQDGASAITPWQTLNAESNRAITLKVTQDAR